MSFQTAPLGTDGEVQQQCSNHRKKKNIGIATMASSYTWQAGEVFEADCTVKFSCKKKKEPVLHIRKKAPSKTMKLLHQTETSVRSDSYSCLFMSRET